MTQGRVRVGIIGANVDYGWGSRAHVPALLALPEYQIVAVCTSRMETAEVSAKRFGVPLAFDDYRKLVSHPDVDLVSVCIRVPLHHPMVMAALESGKHVFCEWPLGATLAEAQEMASLARAKGVRHMVGLQAQCNPALLRLKELVAEGFVGQVLSCNMTMFMPGATQRLSRSAWAADVNKGAHALSIASGHTLDILTFCLGDFQEVSAKVSTQMKQWHLSDTNQTVEVTSPDNVLVSGALKNGAVVSVHVANVPWHGSAWKMEVYGAEGTLVASSEGMAQLADIRLRGARHDEPRLKDIPIPKRLTWVPDDVPGVASFNVAQMFRRMYQGISGGHQVEPNFDHAVKVHHLLAAIEKASETGTRQQVV